MIKAFQLIFEPGLTWEKIAQTKRSAASVLLLYLVPLLGLTLAGELYGLARFGKAGEYLGKPQEFGERLTFSKDLLINYGAAQFLFSLISVALGAKLMQAVAHTFHSRHAYKQCFTVAAYAFGPFYLLRLCDAFPVMHPWVSFAIGIVLTIATLYHGVPRVLEPDPPHAFGLYLCSVLLLGSLAALARLLSLLVLAQKIRL